MLVPTEVNVLIACIRLYFGTLSVEEVTPLLTNTLDWQNLVRMAIANSVMPLLYQGLKAMKGNYVPSAVMTQLQNLYRMNGLNNLSQTEELLEVLSLLNQSGIVAITFKGSVLASAIYGNLALRQYNDLDIMVHRQDCWQAKEILANRGYQSAYPQEVELTMFNIQLQIPLVLVSSTSEMFHRQFQPSLLHSNLERGIDLHWGISPKRIWHTERFEQLWQNLQSVTLMGHSVQTFTPEAALVIHCLNVAKDLTKQRSLKQICDVAKIIQVHTDLNWHLVLELAAELHIQKLCLLGLSITHKLLHIPVPELIQSKLVPVSDYKQIFAETHNTAEKLMHNLWLEYIRQLQTLDYPFDGLMVTVHYMQFFLLKLLPQEQDRQLMPLPQTLAFLYYIIRPLRLLRNYSPLRKLFSRQ